MGGGAIPSRDTFDTDLGTVRQRVADALERTLRRATRAEREKLFHARGDLAERALHATRAYLDGSAPLMEAWRRYEGVVWRHLDPATLETAQRARILVPSALYGLTSANDVIADYRLRMSVRLKSLGPLANFWKAPLSSALIAHVGEATVVDLLPDEHAGAVDLGALSEATALVRVSFVDQKRHRAVGHAAKAVKGVLARCLVLEGLAGLEDFAWEGWRLEGRDGGFVAVSPGT